MKFHTFDRRTIFGRRWYFRFVGRNGEVVAPSEGYNSARARDQAIELLKLHAATAPVMASPR